MTIIIQCKYVLKSKKNLKWAINTLNRTYDRFVLHINRDRKGSVTIHKYT